MRKKRTSTLVRAKYARRTTGANRSLIQSNALAIRAIKRLQPPPIYTDFQYKSAYSPFTFAASGNFFNIQVAELMEPLQWTEVLRQDANVLTASSTLLKRLQINLRYTLGQANWAQITTFIVSIRKDAADRVITEAGLIENQDWIYNVQLLNPRLNPAVFKVLYTRSVSLAATGWQLPATDLGQTDAPIIGDARSTFAKGQVNMKPNFRLRQPLGTPWRSMTQDQLIPAQRFYLMTFFRGNTSEVDNNPPRLDWDALYTCFNAS